MEDLKNVFNVMYVIDAERVQKDAYILKNVYSTFFDQWKEDRDKDAPLPSWACLEKDLLERFFP